MELEAGTLTLQDRRLFLNDKSAPIDLLPMEARLMALLMQLAGQIVSRRTLMKEVWDTDYLGDTRTIDVHVCWLRHKIEQDPARPRLLVTYRGRGYRLCVPDRSH
jgi:two-component system, OmpR family, phosphate regulon response regulator PhoB